MVIIDSYSLEDDKKESDAAIVMGTAVLGADFHLFSRRGSGMVSIISLTAPKDA